jgi:hypothetical protein
MNRRLSLSLFSFISLCLFFKAGLLSASNEYGTNLRIISSDENGCTITFLPQSFHLDTVHLDRKIYGDISFDRSVPFGQSGDPSIPCRIFSVGIPPEGAVTVSLVEADAGVNSTMRLVPVPYMEKREGMVSSAYREGAAYQKSAVVPPVFFRAEEPSWSGVQRIVRVAVFPIRFDPGKNILEIHSRLTIRISFEHLPQTARNWTPVRENSFYEDAILNYPIARKWQVRPVSAQRRLEKAALTGMWYKIPVTEEGVYRITGKFLRDRGVDIGSIQPATLKMCNNGGRPLPRSLSEARPDSLIENPILVSGIEDGRFDESDAVLFFGKKITGWEFLPNSNQWSHYNNAFASKNVYWLGFNDGRAGKRIQTAPASNPTVQSRTQFTDRFFFEQDKLNPLKGGLIWLFNEFDAGSALSSAFSADVNLTDPVPNDTARIRVRFKGGERDSYATHRFNIKFNDATLPLKSFWGESFYDSNDNLASAVKSGKNTVYFSYASSGANANAYLDWFEIEYQRSLNAFGGRLLFYSPMTPGDAVYALSGFSSEPLVLDVTSFSAVRKLPVRKDGNAWVAADPVLPGVPKQYYAVQENAYLEPQEGLQRDDLSDLKNAGNQADMLIITHADFLEPARRLKAFKETQDSLSAAVIDIQDVYDEFSSGLLDPTAVRDFVRYAFMHWSRRPSYLLLFGDGDYDYRNLLSNNDKNWIPPYEAEGLYSPYGNKTTDDWFAYVFGDDSQMDLATGRIPVQTKEQADVVVDKLIAYQTDPDRGDWKSLITFVGDDEKAANPETDNEINHIRASEDVAEHIIPAGFNLRKIFLTDYSEEMQVEGRRKPKAHEDLLDQINRGTLVVNYIGHANEDVWAHERIFNHETDMPVLRNDRRLSFFYAATCSFAWFDEIDKQSFAEDLLAAGGKGAIALIAASRECSAGSNEALNREFMRGIFDPAKRYRIGEALRLAKINTFDVSNNEMYLVIGDPTLRLAFPSQKASFTEVRPDSFKALSLCSVKGIVGKDQSGIPTVQGKVLLKGFDSKKSVTYTTRWGSRLNYVLPGNVLFRGEAAVQNGFFEAAFIIPKEISYGSSTARLSAYFWNSEGDGFGGKDGIPVGGTSNIQDDLGPEIRISFSDMDTFVSGGMVHPDPELMVVIRDEQTGVNLAGEIGHTLSLTVDNQPAKNVTDYFQYDEGSHVQGALRYSLIGLSEGAHEITFKAWDNANNSAVQFLTFRIVPLDDLRLENVLNYPNPFSTSTYFTFQLNQSADIQIKIYTVNGLLIRKLDGITGNPGFNAVPWDGMDEAGDSIANGVYLYKTTASLRLPDKTVEKSELSRLLIMR